MKKGALITVGSLLGIGSAGYYVYRSYCHSDHSMKGTLRQCRSDIKQDFGRLAHAANELAGKALNLISRNGKRLEGDSGRSPRLEKSRDRGRKPESIYGKRDDSLQGLQGDTR